MAVRVGINGFGRIGRFVLRTSFHDPNIEIVGINDLVPNDALAYMLQYDTTHGKFPGTVSGTETDLIIDGKKIRATAERDPANLPWKELKCDYVVESTGIFRDRKGASKHIEAGASRVIMSAPAKDDDIPTLVMGVNHETFDASKDTIVNNASCTTNCLAPIAKLVNDEFGLEEGLMTTVHAMTATQPTVDGPSAKDLRGGRAAGANIIPAATGAAKAVTLCIPELKGKLTGMSFRVPVIDVSVVDLTVRTKKETSLDAINAVMKKASEGSMKDILGYTEEQVVSSDFISCPLSSIYDATAGIQLNPRFFKLVSWYDNEFGYASRVRDLIKYIGKCDKKI